MSQRVLVLVSNEHQAQDVLRWLETEEGGEVSIVSTSPEVDLSTFEPFSVCARTLSYYIGDDPRVLDELAAEVISIQDELEQVCIDSDIEYLGVSICSCVIPEIAKRYIRPIVQGIWGFQQAVEKESPDEIWVSEVAKSAFFASALVESGPSYLEYNILYPILMKRVAAQSQIPVRWLRCNLLEWGKYLLSRYSRPLVFRLYKLWHWWQKPNGRLGDLISGDYDDAFHRAIFLVRARAHAERIGPVTGALKRSNPLVLFDPPLNRNASRVHLNDEMQALAGHRMYVRNLWPASRLERVAREAIRSLPMSGFAFLGIGISDLLEAALKAHFCEFDEIITYIEAVEEVITRLNPFVWVIANDLSVAGQAVCKVCQLHQLPTIMIQHGLITTPPVKKPSASIYAVIGQRAKDVVTNWKMMLPENVVITGMPASERPNQKSVGTFSPRIDSDRPTVTVLTSSLPGRQAFAERASEIAGALDVNVILKVHPSEDINYYKRHLGQLYFEGLVKVIKEVDIGSVLQVTDVLVSYESTVVIEALLSQIPTILLDIPIFYNVVEKPYYSTHLEVVHGNEPLVPIVSDLLLNELRRKAYIEGQDKFVHYLVDHSENAAERIASIVERFLT